MRRKNRNEICSVCVLEVFKLRGDWWAGVPDPYKNQKIQFEGPNLLFFFKEEKKMPWRNKLYYWNFSLVFKKCFSLDKKCWAQSHDGFSSSIDKRKITNLWSHAEDKYTIIISMLTIDLCWIGLEFALPDSIFQQYIICIVIYSKNACSFL